MNFKRSTTSMAIVLMALSLVSMTSIQQDAFAQSLGMSITATADKGSNMITITGEAVSSNDITFTVWSPTNRNLADAGQVTPDSDGKFVKKFAIGGLWSEDGIYQIEAKQGISKNSLYTLKIPVYIENGMVTESIDRTQTNLDTGIFTPNVNNAAVDAGLTLDEIVIENGSTMFELTGMTDRVSEDITILVTSPTGNKVYGGQISPMIDGKFASVVTVGGPLWSVDGFYTVNVQQSNDPKYMAETQIDILDGKVVPEFGVIAVMILAIAIISIIAISAKSRLAIIPRY